MEPANTTNTAEEQNQTEEIPRQMDLEDNRKLIFVLEKAPLEVGKFKGKLELLNSNDHKSYISRKLEQDFSKYRPDITHQCLLSLLDSPLNKAGYMDIYIHTEKNVLIHVNPATKIPRTYNRFSRLMAQLLTKLKIRAQESSDLLLKVVKNPITNHLPPNTLKIGTSTKARFVKLHEYVPTLPKTPILFVIGAVAKGNPCLECDFLDDTICVSRYGLSASNCILKIVNCFEDNWGVY